MILQTLFEPISEAHIFGDPRTPITGLQYHSERICPGEVFFAIRGLREDGTRFIPDALERGAVAVVSESEPQALTRSAVWVQVPEMRKALALASSRFYGNPSSE